MTEIRKRAPSLPDPREKDLNKLNRQMIEVIKYLVAENDSANTSQRLSDLEAKVQIHTSQLNELIH